MASSRNQKTSLQNVSISDYESLLGTDVLDEFSVVDDSLPPKAQSTSRLILNSLTDTNAISSKSAHDVDLHAKKVNAVNGTEYAFKYNKLGSCISEIEAGIAAVMHFYCRNLVASTRAYYDENKNCLFQGVASKKFVDWVPNSKKPLCKADLLLELTTPVIEEQRQILTDYVEELVKKSERTPPKQDSFFNFSGLMRAALNYKNSYFANTGVTFTNTLKNFLVDGTRFLPTNIDNLLKQLQERKEYILINFKDTKHIEELGAIEKVTKQAHALSTLEESHLPPEISIAEYEEFHKRQEKKKVNLKTLNESDFLQETINGKKISLKVRTLMNYRKQRNHGVTMTMNSIIKNADVHNNNQDAEGDVIDYDMAKFNITHRFKFDKINLLSSEVISRYRRKPTKDTFIFTAHNIRNFPDILDGDLVYWPTIETKIPDLLISVLSTVYDITGNLFKYEDSIVYKELKNSKVFKFHQYRTMLKYIMTDRETIKQLYSLHIRKNYIYIDEEGKEKNLLNELINDEMDRIAELKAVLLTMPEFHDFIAKDGETALKMINDEYEEDVAKYQSKLKDKPYYEHLLASIGISKKCQMPYQDKSDLETRYDNLLHELNRYSQQFKDIYENGALVLSNLNPVAPLNVRLRIK